MSETTAKPRRCILLIHGVGEQKKSDTLLGIGSPLVDWIVRWAQLFYARPAAEVGRVQLSFVPFDAGEGDRPAYAVLKLPGGEQWYLAEAWWAGSSFHPDLATMLYWSLVHLFDIIAQMVRAAAERARYIVHPKDLWTSSQPAAVWQLVDLRDDLPSLFAPMAQLAVMLLGLPALVGLAALLGAVVWAAYRLIQWQWWERWDHNARAAFLERAVQSSQQRLRASAPADSAVTV